MSFFVAKQNFVSFENSYFSVEVDIDLKFVVGHFVQPFFRLDMELLGNQGLLNRKVAYHFLLFSFFLMSKTVAEFDHRKLQEG